MRRLVEGLLLTPIVLLAIFLLAPVAVAPVLADEPELIAAVRSDLPPYRMENGTKGLEADIVRHALRGYAVRFVQMPAPMVFTAVQQDRADMAVSVLPSDDGGYYSDAVISFANYAISREADGLEIDNITDLENLPVLTWLGAYLQLGDEFKKRFAPGAPHATMYMEFDNQRDQVLEFWQRPGSVVVIDRTVFRALSKQMGHSRTPVKTHPIFPVVLDWSIRFKDAAVRDAFNQGLTRLCSNGIYRALLERHRVILPRSPCYR